MFQSIAIGNIGGNAEVKGDNGREFVTFRIAHNERWTDAQGVQHDSVQWIDCVMNGRPNVLPYLKAGQLVMVQGNTTLRIYDSAKDHCKKAGVQINVKTLELLGGSSDKVPARLYDDKGTIYEIQKYFHCGLQGGLLLSAKGEQFAVDDNGWVVPRNEAPAGTQE